jgi:hypothetical protein
MASAKVRQLEDNLSAKVRQLEDNLAFRYIADSDRPINIEDPEEILMYNRYDEYLKNKDALEGSAIRASATIGPKETNVIEDVVGGFYASNKLAPIAAGIDDVLPGLPFVDIVPDPPDELPDGGNRMRNAIVATELAASVPALAKGIYTAGSKGIKAYKKVRDVGLSNAWDDLGRKLISESKAINPDRMNLKTKAYIKTRKAIQQLDEYRRNNKTLFTMPGSKRNWKTSIESALWQKTPSKLQKWLDDPTPSKSVTDAVKYGAKVAEKNLYSVEGFKRFLHTVDGGDLVRGQTIDENMPLYKAFRNLIKNEIEGVNVTQMSILGRFSKENRGVAGWAKRGTDKLGNPFKEIELRPGRSSPHLRSTGVHEVTHSGQLGTAGKHSWKELEHIADQYNLSHSDMRLFISKFNTWEKSYMEKLQPYMKYDTQTGKQIKLTDPDSPRPRFGESGYDEWMSNEYYKQPLELSPRMGQIRDAEEIVGKPLSDLLYTVGTGDDKAANLKMLKHMKEREIERVGLSEKGLDYAVNKLWGAAPATLGLDEDLFKEVKE